MFCIVFLFALFSSFSTRSINLPHLNSDKLQNSDDSEVFSTESSDDAAAGFFFRPRFGKRDTEEATAEVEDTASAGFFYRPKHGKRSAPQEDEPATDSSEDLAGFFMRPKHGKRSAQRQIVQENIAAKGRRSVESSTESTETVTAGFFYRPREGRRTAQ